MRYRLTVEPAGLKEFSADSDAEAIARSETPTVHGIASVPRKLEEIRGMLVYRAVRTVKEWA